MYIISKQNLIAIYCLIVFAEEDDLAEEDVLADEDILQKDSKSIFQKVFFPVILKHFFAFHLTYLAK